MKKKIGKPKKTQETFKNEKETEGPKTEVLEKQAPAPVPEIENPEPKRFVEKAEAPDAVRIAESRKSLEQVLPPGQKFFETPDGEIIIGEADKNQVWSRRMNDGKGGWVNPRR